MYDPPVPPARDRACSPSRLDIKIDHDLNRGLQFGERSDLSVTVVSVSTCDDRRSFGATALALRCLGHRHATSHLASGPSSSGARISMDATTRLGTRARSIRGEDRNRPRVQIMAQGSSASRDGQWRFRRKTTCCGKVRPGNGPDNWGVSARRSCVQCMRSGTREDLHRWTFGR